jgi:class 3 adenylate cyclase/tetratricopeptide (TPR) repeat protein
MNDTPIRVTETSAAENLEGERKTVTALFADIKGSTELEQDLDPEQARAIIDPALKIMIDAARHYDGYVQNTGDGIFALFGAPVAHEDHPQRALHAALRIQREIRSYGDRLREAGGVPIEIRVGVNTREVVMRPLKTGDSRIEYAPIGHTTNLASRMQAVARSGAVVVSEATRNLVEGYFQLKSIGPIKVKGVAEPVQVYEVTGLGPLRTRLQRSASRGYTKFVGREHEMDVLRHSAELAKQGRGQIVATVAEAGVGKSRLCDEFKTRYQSGWMVLEAASFSHGKASPHLPVLDLLHTYFGIDSDDDAHKRREKVNSKVLTLDRKLGDALPYLFGLLGLTEGDDPLTAMDARIRRQRTLEALKRVLLRESLNQPLMIVFEDLHWIDEETQAFLNLLADSIGTTKLLLMVSYRPDYSHQWNSKTYYTQLRLDPLSKESAGEMFDALLGVDTIDDSLVELKRLIVEKTEGTPLFMEEVYQALIEEGALTRNGAVKLVRPLNDLKLPTTVQAILASRIDRLPAAQKELLQTLAVIGIEFPLALALDVVKKPVDELNTMLNALQLAEFIYEQPAVGDIEYTFRHALTQEVAYGLLLVERRKVIHERIGQSIETLYADSLDDNVSNLAHHYRRSGNTDKAIDYLVLAAGQTLQRSAFSVATAYLQDALELLRALPDSAKRDRKEIAIHMGLADVAMVMRGYAAPDYEFHLTRQHALAERLGDRTLLFYSLVGISVLSAFRLELSRAREIGEQLVKLADEARDRRMQLYAHGALANVLYMMGEFTGSRSHLEKGIALFARDGHLPYGDEGWKAACLLNMHLCTAHLGFPDEALRQSREFLAWARKRALPHPLAFALESVASLLAWRGDGAEALKYSESVLALSAEHGFTDWLSYAKIVHGQALALLGKTDEAIQEIKGAMFALEAAGTVVPGWVYLNLGACLAARQPGEGLSVVAKALQVADRTGNAQSKAELHRLKGELLLMLHPSDTAEVEVSFRVAIDTARKQSARLPELHATVSLARLLRDTNRRDEARTMLAEIYNWFTEGLDTADLKDARALLDQLNV